MTQFIDSRDINDGPYTITATAPNTGNNRFAAGFVIVAEVSGEYVYDPFVRAEDQWRTIDALLTGIYNRGDIRYGAPHQKTTAIWCS